MEVSQETFENKLMELLLLGDLPILAALREQYANAKVINREFSGKGFFTYFLIPDGIAPVKPLNFAAGNVNIELEGVPGGADCLIFIREGKISFLECYTFSDDWPKLINIKSLSHMHSAIPNE